MGWGLRPRGKERRTLGGGQQVSPPDQTPRLEAPAPGERAQRLGGPSASIVFCRSLVYAHAFSSVSFFVDVESRVLADPEKSPILKWSSGTKGRVGTHLTEPGALGIRNSPTRAKQRRYTPAESAEEGSKPRRLRIQL